jgi:hypothetical protein
MHPRSFLKAAAAVTLSAALAPAFIATASAQTALDDVLALSLIHI